MDTDGLEGIHHGDTEAPRREELGMVVTDVGAGTEVTERARYGA